MLEAGWWGSLKDLSKNILKQGCVKANVVRRGEAVGRCHHPCPSENFNPKKFMKNVLKLCCPAISYGILVTQQTLERFSTLTWQ